MIEAFRRRDAAALAAMSVPRTYPCGSDVFAYVKCKGSDPDGTAYPVWVVPVACNGAALPFAEIEQYWQGVVSQDHPFWAVARLPDGGYAVIFATSANDSPILSLFLRPAGLTSVAGGCSGAVGEAYPPGSDFLVAPR